MKKLTLALVLGVLALSVFQITTAHELNTEDSVTNLMFEHHELMHGQDMSEDEFLENMDKDGDGHCDLCGMSLEDFDEMHKDMEEHHKLMHGSGMGCHG